MNNLKTLKYRMQLRQQLQKLDLDLFNLTKEEVKKENERRNNKKGKR